MSNNSIPLVSLTTDVSQIDEGEQLAIDFDLSSIVPNGGLDIELDLIEGSDSLTQGFEFLPEASSNISNLEFISDETTGEFTGAKVTLAEGVSDATIVSEIIADNTTEGDESVSLGLVASEDYAVDRANDTISLTINDTSTDSPQIIDLTSFTVEISATNDAGFTNIGGFYQAIDTEGTVIDPVTGDEVSPDDLGYDTAALANSVLQIGDGEEATLELDGGFTYVPYLLANGTQFFTAYEEANPDGIDHVQSIGDNTFGFEDLLGGGDNDFNDYVISFDIV